MTKLLIFKATSKPIVKGSEGGELSAGGGAGGRWCDVQTFAMSIILRTCQARNEQAMIPAVTENLKFSVDVVFSRRRERPGVVNRSNMGSGPNERMISSSCSIVSLSVASP